MGNAYQAKQITCSEFNHAKTVFMGLGISLELDL